MPKKKKGAAKLIQKAKVKNDSKGTQLPKVEKVPKKEAQLLEMNEKIKELYKGFQFNDYNSAYLSYGIGELLIALKQLLKSEHSKLTLKEYLKKDIPYITLRTSQRFMRLALNIEKEDAKVLCMLGQTNLLQLITLAKKNETSVTQYLQDSDIQIPEDTEDFDEIQEFKKDVDELLDKKGFQESSSNEADSENDDGDDDDEDDEGDRGEDNNDAKLPTKPKAMIQMLCKEGRSFSRIADHVASHRKRLGQQPISTETITDMDQLIKDLSKRLKSLKKIRDYLNNNIA